MDFKLNIQLFGDNNNDSHRGYMQEKSHEQKMRAKGYKYEYGGKWFKTKSARDSYYKQVQQANMMDSGGGHGATDNGSLAGDGINHGAGWGTGIKGADQSMSKDKNSGTLDKSNSLKLDTEAVTNELSGGWYSNPKTSQGWGDYFSSPSPQGGLNYKLSTPDLVPNRTYINNMPKTTGQKAVSTGGTIGAIGGGILAGLTGAPAGTLMGGGYYLGNKLDGDSTLGYVGGETGWSPFEEHLGGGRPAGNVTDNAGRGGSAPVISAPKKDEDKKPVSGELETPIEAPDLTTGRMYLMNKFRRDTHRLGLGDVISAFGKSAKANSILWKF